MTLAVAAGACTPAGLPQVPASSGQIETSATHPLPAPVETATMASAEPTEVYALVARGIHACWFGARGPLRGSHIFHADARPPSEGGQAQIFIHERGVAMRAERGPQALRVSIEGAVGGARVVVAAIKLPPGYGEPMAHDVVEWAKGRSGCQLRVSFPQPEVVPVQKQPTTKGKR